MKNGFQSKTVRLLCIMIFCITSFLGCRDQNSQETNVTGNMSEFYMEEQGDAAEIIGTEDEKISITLWSHFSDPNSTDGNNIAFFHALESIKTDMPHIQVVHEGTESESYKVKLKTAMAGNELPDVFFNWGAGTTKPYVEAGLLQPLDEYMTEDIRSRIVDGMLENFTFEGKTYGYPYSMAVASLYVNTELFERYDVKIPETYTEFLKAVEAFENVGIIPVSLGEKDLWPGLMIYAIHGIRMAGAEAFRAALNGTGTFETKEFVEAARLVQNLSAAGAFGAQALETSENDAVLAFKQGKAAMMYMGSWLNGECEANDSAVKGKITIIKFPEIEQGKGNHEEFHGGSGETFLVSSNTRYPDEAVAVASYICEKMSNYQYLAGSGLPAWETEKEIGEINRLTADVIELTDGASEYVYWLDSTLGGSKADTVMDEVSKLLAGAVTPERFCENLQKMNTCM